MSQMTPQPGPDAPVSILVVDDNPDDLALFQRAVRATGWRVDTAPSGRDGLKKSLGEHYDVIVLDYNLGDMTGTEVLLRVKEGGVPTPVLIQSGLGGHFIVARALALGAEGFIAKDSPAYEKEVTTKVAQVVERVRTLGLSPARMDRRESIQEVETVLDDLMERGQGHFTAVGFTSPEGFRVSTRFRSVKRLTPETICAMVASATSTCHFLGEGVDFAGLRFVSAEFDGGRFYAAPVTGFGVLFAVMPSERDTPAAARTELELAARELSTLLATVNRTQPYA